MMRHWWLMLWAPVAIVTAGEPPADMDSSLPWLSPETAPALPGQWWVADMENTTRTLPDPFTSIEAADPWKAVQISQEQVRAGRNSLKVHLGENNEIYGGHRVQLTHDLGDQPATKGWYAWSVFIPNDFPEDHDPNHWKIIAEFKDQPNKNKGQSWEQFPSHRAVASLYYVDSGPTPAMAMRIGVNTTSKSWNYGPVEIKKGEWTDMVVHIGWSTGEDGFIEAWANGKPFLPKDSPEAGGRYKGRTMYYAYTALLKLGLFRSPDIHSDLTLYLDEMRTGPTRESVAVPSPAPASPNKHMRLRKPAGGAA